MLLPIFITNILALSSVTFGLGINCRGSAYCSDNKCVGQTGSAMEYVRDVLQGQLDQGINPLYEEHRTYYYYSREIST